MDYFNQCLDLRIAATPDMNKAREATKNKTPLKVLLSLTSRMIPDAIKSIEAKKYR